MFERFHFIFPSRDEFVGDVACIPGLEDCPHDRRIMNFLVLVQLDPPGVAGRMIVGDEVLILPNTANDVPVHNLHVIDVEEQFHAGRVDSFD